MTDRPSDPPVACSLDASELSDRRAVWEALARDAMKDLRATTGGIEVVYAASRQVEPTLRDLARQEATCCSFADWHVGRRGEDELVLDVTSSGEGIDAVRALFGLGASTANRTIGRR